MTNKLKAFITSVTLIAAAMPVAFAQGVLTNPGGPAQPIGGLSDIQIILNNWAVWGYTIFFIAATFYLLYAGFTYMTAAGDEEKAGKAKKMLLYTIAAIAIVILAASVPAIVRSII